MLIEKKTNSKYEWKTLLSLKQQHLGMIKAYRHILTLYDKPYNQRRTQMSADMARHIELELAKNVWEEMRVDEIIAEMLQHHKMTGQSTLWSGKVPKFQSQLADGGGDYEEAFELAMQDEKFAVNYEKQMALIEQNRTDRAKHWAKQMEKAQPKMELA